LTTGWWREENLIYGTVSMSKRKKPLLLRASQTDADGTVKNTAINANDIKPSERRRNELPPDLKLRADALFARVGNTLNTTREKWHDGFLRDLNPEREIAVWERIADVTDALWASEPQELRKLDRRSLLRAVLMVSSQMIDIPSQVAGITDEGVAVIRAAYQNEA
jgi:hypothetical protein